MYGLELYKAGRSDVEDSVTLSARHCSSSTVFTGPWLSEVEHSKRFLWLNLAVSEVGVVITTMDACVLQ